jgi:hypothetical protein
MRRGLTLAALAFILLGVPGAAAADEGRTDIVGGGPTTIEEWPWQVAVASPPDGRDGYDRQFCGGSLLSATAVVTAAHCVYDSDLGEFLGPEEFSVITGRTVLSSSAGAESPVSDVIYFVDAGGAAPQSVGTAPVGPELYDEDTSEWDVAVLELADPAPPPAAPIAIASPAERDLWQPGDTAYATGWGDTTGAGLSFPDDLREVEFEVISDTDCGDGTSYGSGFVPSVMVCAGVPTVGGKDTCQGDSGGPLVVPAGDGTFRLIGDTSFGDGCGLPERPGVYGRLADEEMRPAVLAGAAAANGDPAPAPPAQVGDTVAPRTILGRTPKKRTTKRVAKFTWTANEAATFECRLDKGPTRPCASPFRVRVKAGKRHVLRVSAIDAAGNVEDSPAKFSWKVLRPKRR